MSEYISRGRKARRCYGFDEVALVPGNVTINPNDVDVSWTMENKRIEVPIIAAAMDGVVDTKFAIAMGKLGGLAVFASLHDGDPGATGENELSGGDPSYVRKAIAWNPATGGIMDSSNQPVFDIPAGKTIKHMGLWSAVTGGTFYLSAPIVNEAFASQGTHVLTDGDLDLNA